MDQTYSFEDVIEQNKALLYKVVRIYCQNEDDRGDLLQEIKIQLWRSFDRYDGSCKLSTWIYRISLNVAISFYRKSSVRSKHTVPIDEDQPVEVAADGSDKNVKLSLLETFIGELKEFDKALMLLYLNEKSHVDIADILGISVSNVSTKIGRIKGKLKERFKVEGY